MDKNGLLLRVIAARGAYPERKTILWYGPGACFCNECAEEVLKGESKYGAEPFFSVGYAPHISFLDDEGDPPVIKTHFVCIECNTPLKDHNP